MLQIDKTTIPVETLILSAYFDDSSRLVYVDSTNTISLNCRDGSYVLTHKMEWLNRYCDDSCIGIVGNEVWIWNYLEGTTNVLEIPNAVKLRHLYYDHEHGIGVLENRISHVHAQFLLLDSKGNVSKLLQNHDNEYLLGLMSTDKGMLARMGVDDEFDTTQIRYLNQFDEPIAFRPPTVIFPKYQFRYERRIKLESPDLYSNRILTREGEIVFELDTRAADLVFMRMLLHDGENFIAYNKGLLLISASKRKVLAELPKRSWTLLHSEGGGYVLGNANVDSEEPESKVRDYWIFDLKTKQVVDSIRLSDRYDKAVCSSDGSKIMLFGNGDYSRKDRRHAVLLNRL